EIDGFEALHALVFGFNPTLLVALSSAERNRERGESVIEGGYRIDLAFGQRDLARVIVYRLPAEQDRLTIRLNPCFLLATRQPIDIKIFYEAQFPLGVHARQNDGAISLADPVGRDCLLAQLALAEEIFPHG